MRSPKNVQKLTAFTLLSATLVMLGCSGPPILTMLNLQQRDGGYYMVLRTL